MEPVLGFAVAASMIIAIAWVLTSCSDKFLELPLFLYEFLNGLWRERRNQEIQDMLGLSTAPSKHWGDG